MKALKVLAAICVAMCLSGVTVHAQNITRAEYFFDTDPGPGAGTNIPIPSPGADVTLSASIPVGSLSAGFHILGIRVKTANGSWSIFEPRGFYVTSSLSNVSNIAAAEYFIDTDPAPGNGTAIAVTPGPTSAFTFPVSTAGLSSGFHFLSVRVKSQSGQWSIFESRGFYISTGSSNVPGIVAAEYFFDSDPGAGHGTPIPVTPGPNANLTAALPTSTLASGFHFIGIRVQAANGLWSNFEGRGFYVSSSVNNVAGISAAEYFVDNDPGPGLAAPLTIPAGSQSQFTASIPTEGLTPGFHLLTIRMRDSEGKWGAFESRGFYVTTGTNNASDIVAAEYYIDTDPGPGQGIPITINTPGPTITEPLIIELSGVASGVHVLGIRVMDSNGAWSEYLEDEFTVLTCTPPAPPVVVNQTRCGAGTVTLEAGGANAGQEYRWYATALDMTALHSGASYNTPALNETTSFFVSVFDPVTLCESSRTKVDAIVVAVEKPSLNATGIVQLCEGTSFLLSAPDGFTSYTWSDGSQTQRILVTTAGSYSVVVSSPNCTLPSSDVTTFTFLPKPETPTIGVDGELEICEAGEVTLTAPDGFAAYEWSSGETAQSVTKTAAGAYTLLVGNEAGCKSTSSLPATVKIFTAPSKPAITVTGLETICEDDFTVLSAPTGFTQYLWSTGEITQSIIIEETSTVHVQVADGASCFSTESDELTITQTGVPCAGDPVANNAPPTLLPISVSLPIRGSITVNVLSFVSDTDGSADIDPASIRIVTPPVSGASASIDDDHQLVLNYASTPFTGFEFLSIQVCDRAGSCTQGDVKIDVVSDIVSYNALSPNNDNLNEFVVFEFIDILPDSRSNKVTIYNRWGSPVIEITDYDNDSRVFRGLDQSGNELPNGTYFYKIVFTSGRKSKEGFITLRR